MSSLVRQRIVSNINVMEKCQKNYKKNIMNSFKLKIETINENLKTYILQKEVVKSNQYKLVSIEKVIFYSLLKIFVTQFDGIVKRTHSLLTLKNTSSDKSLAEPFG